MAFDPYTGDRSFFRQRWFRRGEMIRLMSNFSRLFPLCPIDVEYAERGTEVTVASAPYKADHRCLRPRAAL